MALSEKDDKTLVSDGWGLKVTRSAVIVHVKNHQTGKQLERFLAVDDFMRNKACDGMPPPVELRTLAARAAAEIPCPCSVSCAHRDS